MNKKGLLSLDWYLILPVVALIIVSLFTLFSLNFQFFKNQLSFLIISLAAFLFFSQANYKILKIYSKQIYVISLALFVLVFFIGFESRGSVRWIDIFGFRIQFSEVLKPFLAISLAGYLTEKKNFNFKSFLQIFLLVIPIAGLIFIQPDLGDALIYVGVVFLTVLYMGFPLKYFLGIFIPVLTSIPFFWTFLHDYQRQRVLTYINPGNDPLGTSYNAIQSVIAVGSGMFFGRGLGQGTQSGLRFLPERHTDFIFATISEQLGFFGSVIVLICFIFLLYKIYSIFLNCDDKFSKTFSAIVFFAFLIQIFVNVGMNIGIIPIVGVTLPFVSSGGSSLLSNFIFLGFLTAISRKTRSTEVLEIK